MKEGLLPNLTDSINTDEVQLDQNILKNADESESYYVFQFREIPNRILK